MQHVLLITVRFHDGRYHGTGDWPPSPARLFQALVAGIGQDGPLNDDASKTLEWLEQLAPPVIAAPHMSFGMTIPMHFVPNNDLDAYGGQESKLGKTRSAFKVWKPKLFDQHAAFHYAWQFDESASSLESANHVCAFADRLYQLGRGVDQAWAAGEVIDVQQLDERLTAYAGVILRPTSGRDGIVLACPQQGSLKSLIDRHEFTSQRFKVQGHGRAVKLQFSQAPKPCFTPTAYGGSSQRQVFELHSLRNPSELLPWPLARVAGLIVAIRDGAVARLKAALPDQASQIEKCLVGRKADGKDDAPKAVRVRLIPLPSIGHHHADHEIRRLLVEVPAACLLRAEDVFWAFSGLELSAVAPASPTVLTATSDDSMLRHFGLDGQMYKRWRTVTPAALSEVARRRRIDPTRRLAEAKPGSERRTEQERAAGEVIQALRHAELPTAVEAIRVQREPFEANGERVEAFAPETRFPKERLWHIELVFHEAYGGPFIIGDGRYYGLGLMAPVSEAQYGHLPAEGILDSAP